MSRSRQLLCTAYGAIAVLALVGTWTQNVAYFRPDEGLLRGFAMATARFWPATLATPASVSITVDLAFMFGASSALMFVEARRVGVRFVWLYVVLGFAVAISVTFPLFLIARERRLAALGRPSDVIDLSGADLAALVGLGGMTAAITAWTLGR
jgi:hypothetical protein